MQNVFRTALKAAKSDASVLILGETGVGKEVVAGFIHSSSKRSKKTFKSVNCAAIPEELLESEFFGYSEGSFTGASKNGKTGLLTEASGGTLFLDEIGELPLRMQSKLLRFLQDGKFMPVGGHAEIEADVRIIAATNLPKEQLMTHTNFRQDLFYRLSVIPINIPPLRKRRNDIIPLIHHFVRQFNVKYEMDIHIPAKLIKRLHLYDWPGNVRELKNFIERLVILADTDDVGEEEIELMLNLPDTPQKSDSRSADNLRSDTGTEVSVERLIPFRDALHQLEDILFHRAYAESGSILQAAKLLGIHPSTIHRKLKSNSLRIR